MTTERMESSRRTLFDAPVIVVSQKGKLIELTNEYQVFDENGQTLGSVMQTGQSKAKKVMRFLTDADQFLTHRLEVRDAKGMCSSSSPGPRSS